MELENSILDPIQWNEPFSFDYEPMGFDTNWLPSPLNEYAKAISISIQVPVDMPAVALLSVLALCNAGKYEIEGKLGYYEPLNMFCVIVGNPSERKSAVLKEVISPIIQFETEENDMLKNDIAENICEKNLLHKELKILEDQALKDTRKRKKALEKAKELSNFKELRPKRYIVDDITIEKLASMLCEHNGRLGIISSEGNIFDIFSGQYSKKENFDCVLKAYSGDSIRVDRQGRASEYVNNPVLTMLLGIQPSVLSSIISNKSFQGKGLISRFFFCFPKSKIGSRQFKTPEIPKRLNDSYGHLVRQLMNNRNEVPQILRLSDDAKAIFIHFYNEIEGRLINDLFDLQAFAGKLTGMVLRICGNIHVAKNPESPQNRTIDKETMSNAIHLGRYAISHALKASEVSFNSKLVTCKYIIERITSGDRLEIISKRDILRLCQRLKTAKDLQPFLDTLIDYGYLLPDQTPDEECSRGRPSEKYYINPFIYKNIINPKTVFLNENDFEDNESVK